MVSIAFLAPKMRRLSRKSEYLLWHDSRDKKVFEEGHQETLCLTEMKSGLSSEYFKDLQ